MRYAIGLLTALLLCGKCPGGTLVLEYSFRVPADKGENYTRHSFYYSKGPIVVDSASNQIMIRGHSRYNDCATLKIPPKPASGLAQAQFASSWFDPSSGAAAAMGPDYYISSLTQLADGNLLNLIQPWYNTAKVNTYPFVVATPEPGEFFGPWNGGQHSLSLGNYACRLSPNLQTAFGAEFSGGGTITQGTAASNWGPSLYTFNLPPGTTPPLSVFKSTPRITYPYGSTPYKNWYPSWQVASIACTEQSIVWFGRAGYSDIKNAVPVGSNTPAGWYGEAITTFTTTTGGTITVSDEASTSKGYHSDKFRKTAFWCSHQSLVNGTRTISEQNLSFCTGRNSEIYGYYDAATKRMYILDSQADPNTYLRPLPLIHVCKLQ